MEDVVFVYLGSKPANYIKHSLELAGLLSGVKVTLIAERSTKKIWQNSKIDFIEVEDFYNPEKFGLAKKNVSLDHEFRNGFWLVTLERFFVLEQFMQVSNRDSFFHAELDQLLFGVDDLLAKLDQKNFKGLYFPLHNLDKAVASVMYCNSKAALQSLTNRACVGDSFANEMELLIEWISDYPEYFFALPTLNDVNSIKFDSSSSKSFNVVDHKSIGGIVDAAELGLWVGGRDPRNLSLRQKPTNKFMYPLSSSALSKNLLQSLRFEFKSEANQLFVQANNYPEVIRVYNLHIQSKIHSWLALKDSNLVFMIHNSNLQRLTTFPGTRRMQVIYAIRVILRRIRKEKFRYIYAKFLDIANLIFLLIKNNYYFKK